MKAIGRQSFLIVFDFDHTVVDCNTDEVIPNYFHLHHVQKKLKNVHQVQWTKLMDTLMSKFSKEEIIKAAKASVEMESDMKKVFEYLIACKNQYRAPDDANNNNNRSQPQHRVPEFIEINIASDANLLFIDAALDANLPFLKPHLSQIHSNPYYDLRQPHDHHNNNNNNNNNEEEEKENGLQRCYGAPALAAALHTTNQNDEADRDALLNRLLAEEAIEDAENYQRIVQHLRASQPHPEDSQQSTVDVAALPRQSRISWYEPFGHQCPCCLHRGKPNMCKTKIIQRLLNATTTTDTTIIFIGDGANDYCPILNLLRPRDFMFARRKFPIHDILSTAVPSAGAQAAAAAAAAAARTGGEAPPHHHPYFKHEGNVVGGCCHIGLWESAAELLQLFQTVLQDTNTNNNQHAALPPRLPTLARFNDINPLRNNNNHNNQNHEEFRTVTMHRRIQELIERTTRLLATESDPNAAFTLSETAKFHIQKLLESTVKDEVVPLLPGQTVHPNWLRSFAYTVESNPPHLQHPHTQQEMDVTSRASVVNNNNNNNQSLFVPVGPRWGQMPWLHGEIYFYHLLFQYLLLKDDPNTEHRSAAAEDWIQQQKVALWRDHQEQAHLSEEEKAVSFYKAFHTINAITPTMMYNPLFSQETNFNHPAAYTFENAAHGDQADHHTAIITGGLVVPPVMPHQTDADAQVLFHFPLLTDLGTIAQHANGTTAQARAPQHEKLNPHIPQDAINPIPLSAVLPPPGDSTLPTWQHHAAVFAPYQDIFLSEKRDVTRHFIEDKRIINMIVSLHAFMELESAQLQAFAKQTKQTNNNVDLEAYFASDDGVANRFTHFTEILFKWMLWGNGVDLSMFSPEELKSFAADAAKADTKRTAQDTEEAHLHREEEAFLRREQRLMGVSDNFILANQIPQIVNYFKHLFIRNAKVNAEEHEHEPESHPPHEHPVNRDKSIDIVMDNTGVESVADMCFALWFLFFINVNNNNNNNNTNAPHESGRRRQANHVNFHVKPIPYYISDVTARDFALVLALLKEEVVVLEQQRTREAADVVIDSAATAVAALRYFIAAVEQHLLSGAFRIDADTVWVQPSEFRELPPRVVNRYFYSQHIAAGAVAQDNLYSAHPHHPHNPKGVLHRCNKDRFFPQSQFVLFKGDLNFRRLIGDRHWNESDFTQFLRHKNNNNNNNNNKTEQESEDEKARDAFLLSELLQDTLPAATTPDGDEARKVNPDFQLIVQQHWPTHCVPVCAIRTIKSEVCAGVPVATKDKLDALYWKEEAEGKPAAERSMKKHWRTSGQYGVILWAHE